MGKSSSRRKSSCQSRSRKKTKTKTRTRKVKSKKLHSRRDRSLSCSADDDSRSFSSSSYSSSENDYRRSRKSRSRTRKDGKGVKKVKRRPSSSHVSSEVSPPGRKGRGLKRKIDSDVGRKTYSKKKKKARRDTSVSSFSSQSRSCSTSRGGNNSDDQSGRDAYKYGTKKNDRRRSEKVKRGANKNIYRSRSSSLCNQRSESSDYQYGEEGICEKIPGRLRSIVVRPEENEGGEFDENRTNEEIMKDRDDYSPYRSNDSIEGGSKTELFHHSHLASECQRQVEIDKEEEAVAYKIGTPKQIKDERNGRINVNSDWEKDHVKENKRECNGTDGSGFTDLESILRQKALENLKRFQGGYQRNAKSSTILKDTNVSSVKEQGVRLSGNTKALVHSNAVAPRKCSTSLSQSTLENVKTVQGDSQMNATVSVDQEGSNDSSVKQLIGRASLVQINSEEKGGGIFTGKTQPISIPIMARSSTCSEQNDQRIPFQSEGERSSAKQDVVCSSDQVDIAGNQREKLNSNVGPIANKFKLGITDLRHNLSRHRSTSNNAPDSLRPKENFLMERTVENIDTNLTRTVDQSSGNKEEVNSVSHSLLEHSSCPESIPGTYKQQDEAKDGSQYEQKTMSVMRGGEMVQVSYKVYIPKKSPALARRKLKR